MNGLPTRVAVNKNTETVVPVVHQANLPLLQRELLHCAHLAKQSPHQYLIHNERLLFDADNHSPLTVQDLSDVGEKRKSPDRYVPCAKDACLQSITRSIWTWYSASFIQRAEAVCQHVDTRNRKMQCMGPWASPSPVIAQRYWLMLGQWCITMCCNNEKLSLDLVLCIFELSDACP